MVWALSVLIRTLEKKHTRIAHLHTYTFHSLKTQKKDPNTAHYLTHREVIKLLLQLQVATTNLAAPTLIEHSH